jgi:hypothetical protein
MMIYFVIITPLHQLIPSQTPEQFSKLPCSTAVICHVIFYVLRYLIEENLVQYFYINTISYAVNLINFIIITLIYYIAKQRVCETISIIKMLTISKNLVWHTKQFKFNITCSNESQYTCFIVGYERR